jgi:hypothetical protein
VTRPGQPENPMTAVRFSDVAEEVIASLVAGIIAEQDAHRQLVQAADERAANMVEYALRGARWPAPRTRPRRAS